MPDDSAPPAAPALSRGEGGWALVVMSALLALNAATASRSPTVWMDEVHLVDISAGWLETGRPSTTGAELAVGASARAIEGPYLGNWPLHILLATPWVGVLGLRPTPVRALGVLIFTLAVGVTWYTARRRGYVDARGGLLLIVLLFCGNAISFSYRGARPDVEVMLVAALTWLAHEQPVDGRRRLGAILCGLLAPTAGVQSLPLAFALLGVAVVAQGRRSATFALWFAGGAAASALGLASIYAALGTLDLHLLTVLSPSAAGQGGLGALLARVATPRSILQDPSLVVLLLPTGLALIVGLRRGDERLLRAGRIGLALAAAIPATLAAAGRFPVYYAWMAYAPVAIVVADLSRAFPSGACRRASLAAVAVAALVGLPARTAVCLLQWEARDPARVDALVAAAVTSDDVVLIDYPAYYAVRGRARVTYLPTHARALTPEGREGVDVVVCRPDRGLLVGLPGCWERVATLPAAPSSALLPEPLRGRLARPYELEVHRRIRDRAR